MSIDFNTNNTRFVRAPGFLRRLQKAACSSTPTLRARLANFNLMLLSPEEADALMQSSDEAERKDLVELFLRRQKAKEELAADAAEGAQR